MTPSLKLFGLVGATAVLAGLAGYLVAARQVSSVLPIAFTASYLSAASDAALDVDTLRAIHGNDLSKATAILEAQIDSRLIHLSLYHDAIPPEWRDASVYADLAKVRQYRAESSTSIARVTEAQAAIDKAFALRPDARDRK